MKNKGLIISYYSIAVIFLLTISLFGTVNAAHRQRPHKR